MRLIVKKILLGMGATLGMTGVGASGYAKVQANAFDESMAKAYDIAPLAITRSSDPAVIARGEHLVDAVAGCSSKDCHGADLAGGAPVEMGPLGVMTGPNVTGGGMLPLYSDGELARLLRFGVRKDGRSTRFMPAQDFNWLPDEDLTAVVSYLRAATPVEKPNGVTQFSIVAKVLDRRGALVIDVARKIAATKLVLGGRPASDADYGRFLAKSCTGCHGETLSGGAIPGTPPSMPVPLNLTPHATGMRGWTYDDFDRLLTKGARKNGATLSPFMPIDSFGQMNDTEKHALFAYLSTLPGRPFGGR